MVDQLLKERTNEFLVLVATAEKNRVSGQMSLMTVAKNFFLNDIPLEYMGFDATILKSQWVVVEGRKRKEQGWPGMAWPVLLL